MKNAVFWDVLPCKSRLSRRFGGKYRPHLQGRKILERRTSLSKWLQIGSVCSNMLKLVPRSTLKMKAIRSSETSVHMRLTRRYIAENGILHSHPRENLKSCKLCCNSEKGHYNEISPEVRVEALSGVKRYT
jgi:hypothetical protein